MALTVLCTGDQNRRFRDESFTESLRDRERGNSYLPHFLILFCSTCFLFFSLLLFFFLSSFTSIFTILYLISIRRRFPCNGTLLLKFISLCYRDVELPAERNVWLPDKMLTDSFLDLAIKAINVFYNYKEIRIFYAVRTVHICGAVNL